jgi:hypothetical protein
MKLKELKGWIEKLPTEAEEYDVVLAQLGQTEDKQYWYRKDDPVYALDLDKVNNEVIIMRYSKEVINKADIDGENEVTENTAENDNTNSAE